MKIKLTVPPAYAVDYLAILMVKDDMCLPVSEELEECLGSLAEQFGEDLMGEILDSSELMGLYNTNYELFKAVDAAKQEKITAKQLDYFNVMRFRAKQEIHKKFFEGSLEERKNF